jgi:hypothetical protein
MACKLFEANKVYNVKDLAKLSDARYFTMVANVSLPLKRSADCYRMLSRKLVESQLKNDLILIKETGFDKLSDNYTIASTYGVNSANSKVDNIDSTRDLYGTINLGVKKTVEDFSSDVLTDDLSDIINGTIDKLDETILCSTGGLVGAICAVVAAEIIPDEVLRKICSLIKPFADNFNEQQNIKQCLSFVFYPN